MNARPNFAGQFVVSTAARPHPVDWATHATGGVVLHASPQTIVISVFDAERIRVGTLIGTPIDLDRQIVVKQEYELGAAVGTCSDIDAFLEDTIYRLAGSFLFILHWEGCNRIYLDANGSLSLVYDPVAGTAAATAAVLLDEAAYETRFRKDLYAILDVRHDGWFTAGLTAHRGVERLLCNHYLDLETWTAVRHWPTAPITPSEDPAAAYARVCSRIAQTIQLLAARKETSVALTAGHDSRLLLACCRQAVEAVSFVTVGAPVSDIDVACARRLADTFGLHHAVLPYREATPAQAELWRRRCGHCVGGENVKLHPSVQPLEGQYFIGGMGGEIGRGFLWLDADDDTVLDARDLVARLKLPRNGEVIERVDAWLRPLSHFDTLFELDLAYIELRLDCWGFCDSYVRPAQNELHPIVSRANYIDMLSVAPELRRKGRIFREAIAACWPEILAVPINRYGDWRDNFSMIKKALRDPRRAGKKAIQLVRALRLAGA